MISPDPRREDSRKDLDLPFITRRMIRKMEKAVGKRLFFVAAVHNADHTPIRHVHGVFLVHGRLSKEQFRLLQEVACAEATGGARLLRRARDIALQHPRYQALAQARRLLIRGMGGGRAPKVQPGCRTCGFGEFTGILAYKTHCPICRASLRQEPQVRFRLNRQEGRLR
jgi:hypothetical protein